MGIYRKARRMVGKAIRPRPSVAEATQEHVNLFDTFGFVKLPGYFKDEVKWIGHEFDRMMAEKYGQLLKNRPYFYPQFADSSAKLTALLENPKVVDLAQKFCGENYIYKGSDGNMFVEGSPWHRDYLVRTKSMKMLVYLEHNKMDGGPFCAIPGSHFVDDTFSSYLTAALTWPEPPVLGGFDEKRRFGMGNNPKIIGQNENIPYVKVDSRPGDVIIFNHNLVHCVNAPISAKQRRLFGLHFCADLRSQPQIQNGELEMAEMRRIALYEMRDFKLPHYYGPCVMASQSPAILKQTEFLRSLRVEDIIDPKTFDGLAPLNSSEAVDVCSRLKNDSYREHRFLN